MAASTVPASHPKPQSVAYIESFFTHLAIDMARFAKSFNKPLESLTGPEIRGFLAHELLKSPPHAVARKLSTIQHFYCFLVNEEVIQIDPAQSIRVLNNSVRCTFKLANPKKHCKAKAAKDSCYCTTHHAIAAIFATQETK
jgi:site-specific recombinase XerC